MEPSGDSQTAGARPAEPSMEDMEAAANCSWDPKNDDEETPQGPLPYPGQRILRSHEALPGDRDSSYAAEQRAKATLKDSLDIDERLRGTFLRPNDWVGHAGIDEKQLRKAMPPQKKRRRTEDNCPPMWQLGFYLDGCSFEPQTGSHALKIRYCHPMAWLDRTVYVHPTATSADVKWFMEKCTQTQHHKSCLIGMETGTKCPWFTELTTASWANQSPFEMRVLIPTHEQDFATPLAQGVFSHEQSPQTPSAASLLALPAGQTSAST